MDDARTAGARTARRLPSGALAGQRVVLATGNIGKQRELTALLGPLGFELVLQTALNIESAEETGDTFQANALLKARHAARLSGLPALADDSGIEVDALGGRPGVWSARYAGAGATDAANNAKLLAELADLPASRRTARYRCVIAFVADADDPEPLLAEGAWEGRIGEAPRGAGGFGYDPLFWPQGLNVTAAEMPAAEKNAISHRGLALTALLAQLR
ncbi:MAG TPA: RdgB/HAM1 family non-canonical purine NTP pyrophosphatase [Steroidobacteraceae bacterium]|nr:RdgB/HAM1 family non-canonical purine NTP pyrophosphatase [Steroidobacteraceae bacterium]